MDNHFGATAIVDNLTGPPAFPATLRDMTFRFRVSAPAGLLSALMLVLTACASVPAGTAQPGAAGSGRASGSSPSSSARTTERTTEPTIAHITPGPAGVPAPTGEYVARPADGRVCFAPVDDRSGVPPPCLDLSPGDRPVFAVFAPDGESLLVVAGPDEQRQALYVLDPAAGRVRAVGPDGVTDVAGEPPRWDLSSVAWSVDGRFLVIVPTTTGVDGPLLAAAPESGRITELARLPADLANGRPGLWPTRAGVALVNNAGADRQSLWWLASQESAVAEIARFPDPGGSLYLAAADPVGRVVLICPRNAEGKLGAISAVGVGAGSGVRVLPESGSCAGAVFSPDGSQVALTAQVGGQYVLIVIEVATDRRVRTVPLPATEPSRPPYLTWLDDTITAADVTGEWPRPSLVIRLG